MLRGEEKSVFNLEVFFFFLGFVTDASAPPPEDLCLHCLIQ